LGILGLVVISANIATGGEYRLWQYGRWPVFVPIAIATVLLVALQAPPKAFLAFAGFLMLITLIHLVWTGRIYPRR
jgi:hypothetical protein